MCPACLQRPVAINGVCSECNTERVAALGPDWQSGEVGRYLIKADRQTAQLEASIANSPTGSYMLDQVPAPEADEARPSVSKEAALDQIIEALVRVHGFGYRRVRSFLAAGNCDPPSLSTIKRRVRRVQQDKQQVSL